MLAIVSPGYFSRANLTDLLLANIPVLIVALGATMVIVSGEIDISVGAVFAVCSVVAGLLSKAGAPLPAMMLGVVGLGALFGALNGGLVAWLGVFDRRHAGDDGGIARCAAMVDARRVGAGPA